MPEQPFQAANLQTFSLTTKPPPKNFVDSLFFGIIGVIGIIWIIPIIPIILITLIIPIAPIIPIIPISLIIPVFYSGSGHLFADTSLL